MKVLFMCFTFTLRVAAADLASDEDCKGSTSARIHDDIVLAVFLDVILAVFPFSSSLLSALSPSSSSSIK
jgi:hypothetical protein